jgi:hypothetical protein
MKAQIRYIRLFFLAILIGITAGSCSSPSYINVTYRLPAKSEALAGKSVLLAMKDTRPSNVIFDKKAQEEFKYFTGIFSLSLAMGTKDSLMLGPFDLPSLFEESFRKRIQQSGVNVVTEQTGEAPVLEIVLRRFFLELVGRKWHADIAYEARLIKDETVMATQVVSGQAERVKIMGQGGAEKVIGDIFSEIVNKLDVYKLFLDAKLS